MNWTKLRNKWWILSREPGFWVAVIFVLALSTRLYVLLVTQPLTMGADERFYAYLARRVSGGGSAHNKIFMPGWPVLLSGFAALGIPRLAPVVFGSLTAPLLYLLGRRTLGETTGRLAAAILALYPDHVFFSQTLYAETALETLLVGATLLAFRTPSGESSPARDWALSFLFGALVLVKHFAVVCFGAFALTRVYERRPWAARAGMAAGFLVPLLLFGAAQAVKGRDPLMVVNSPLKSMREWAPVARRGAGFRAGVNRGSRMSQHLDFLSLRSPAENVRSFVRNFCRLWSPGTYIYRRSFKYDAYRRPPFWFPWVHIPLYLMLVGLGVAGLSFGEASTFRRYCAAVLLLVSCLPAFVFMMSRYRYPFMFPLFLYAADVLARHRMYRRIAFVRPDPKRWAVFAVTATAMILVWIDRLPNLRDYQ